MRNKTKRGTLAVLAAVMAIAVTIGFAPEMTAPVYADDGAVSAINIGTDVLRTDCNTAGAKTVIYGGNGWRVIGYNGEGAASTEGSMTMLAAKNLGLTKFGSNYYYASSMLKPKVDEIAEALTEGEKAAVVPRTLIASNRWDYINTDWIAGDEVQNALMWPLSTKEANAVSRDLRTLMPPGGYSWEYYWWLRSMTGNYNYAATVSDNGIVADAGGQVGLTKGVRPAFYLKLGSVLFVSAAEGGKVSGAAGSDALTPVGAVADNGWKLTVKDSSHGDFSAKAETITDDAVTVSFSGAATGNNEYISAIIVNSRGKVEYYGRVKSCASGGDASGTVTIDTNGKLRDKDSLFIVNEQINEDSKTDYGSNLIPVISKPTYEWADDNSSVTARLINVEDGSVETETADTTSKVTMPPYCDRTGAHTYTAEFSNPAFETQTKEVADMPALGHNWGAVTYEWNGDNSSVTARRVCRRDPRIHIEAETKDTKVEITKPATCEERGKTTYTAEFHKEAFETQTRVVENDALGHDWGEWEVTTPATTQAEGVETRTCKRDPSHTDTRSIPKPDHDHDLSLVEEDAASCTESGTRAHYVCSTCSAIYLDAEGRVQTSEDGIRIPATGHRAAEPEKGEETTATCSSVGGYNLTTKCSTCGAVLKVERIVDPIDVDAHNWNEWEAVKVATTEEKGLESRTCKNDPSHKETRDVSRIDPSGGGEPVSIRNAEVTLSASAFAYNGKVRKPEVRTIGGSALKAGTDYTITWSDASSKGVGSYTLTITGTGNYTGVTAAAYRIDPKGTVLKKPKTAKKAIVVKWKKQSAKMAKSRITGYQILLATDSKFTKNKKTVNVKGYKKASKKVTKLKGGKKYYVKIRTYMTAGGKTCYSAWSKAKKVRTKK